MTPPPTASNAKPAPWRSLAIAATATAVVALVVRLAYISEYRADPTFDLQLLDQLYNDDLARRILRDGAPREVWFRPPGYVWFLAALRAVFAEGYLGIRVVQAVVGLLGVALTALLAGRTFGNRAAWIAGAIMALCGSLVVADAELLSPVLVVPLNAAMLLLLGEAARCGRAQWWIGAGIAAGASAVVRPDVLPFLPVAAALVWWMNADRRRASIGVAAFAVAAAAIVLPLAARNRIVGGEWVLVSANGGANFYIGNNAESDGRSVTFPGLTQWGGGWEDTKALAEREAGRTLSWSEASSHFFAKGLASWRENPGAMATLALRKLWYFGHGLEILNSRDDYTSRHFSVVARVLLWPFPPHLPWGLLGPIAMGVAFWAWRRGGAARLLVAYIAVYWVVVAAFFVTGRFRLPVVPAAAVLAAGFVHAILSQGFASKTLRVPLIVAAVALVAFNIPQNTGSWKPGARSQYAYAAGTALANAGRADEAIPLLAEAWHDDPQLDDAALFLADAYRTNGDFAAAEGVYAKLLERHPDNASMHAWMGEALAMQGRADEAVGHLRRAVMLDPSSFDGHMGLASLLLQGGGDTTEARGHLEAADRAKPDARARHLLGVIAESEGRRDEAVAYYRGALEVDPTSERSRAALDELTRR